MKLTKESGQKLRNIASEINQTLQRHHATHEEIVCVLAMCIIHHVNGKLPPLPIFNGFLARLKDLIEDNG